VRREDLRVVFGRRVRELRRAMGLSQEELAERSGLHRNYIGGIERGERNVALLNIGSLAVALEVNISELFKDLRATARRR
jgi:transcriptional regulator with XRE-family HTH domain